MFYAAAAEQFAVLRDAQSERRASVEALMAAFEAAEVRLRTAQQQEAQLTDMLRAAQVKTAQAQRAFDTTEARLREAAEDLAEIQARCHALESCMAAHHRCQRSALLLFNPTASLTNDGGGDTFPSERMSSKQDKSCKQEAPASASSQLCWMDPYSVLHAPSGQVFSYDLVANLNRRFANAIGDMDTFAVNKSGNNKDGAAADSDAETSSASGGEAGSPAADATLTSLLQEAAHDVLQGFHYTLLTTSHGVDALKELDMNEAASAVNSNKSEDYKASDISQQQHQRRQEDEQQFPYCPVQLARYLLTLLQAEAVRCRTRALSVSLAIGRVVPSTATTPAHLEDVLHPLFTRHNTAAATGRIGHLRLLTVLMDAAVRDDAGGGEEIRSDSSGRCEAGVNSQRRSRSRSSSLPRWDDAHITARPSRTSSKPRQASPPAFAAPPSFPSLLLTGVQVRSLDEVDAWLEKAGLTSREKGSWESNSCVILLGVDSQDGAGKLHKALLRVVCDTDFSLAGLVDPSLSAVSASLSAPQKPSAELLETSSRAQPPAPSLCFLFMLSALAAVLDQLALSHGLGSNFADRSHVLPRLLSSSQSDDLCEEPYANLERLVELILAEPHLNPSAAEMRAAVRSLSADPSKARVLLREVGLTDALSSAKSQLSDDKTEEWKVWTALLESMFGGNTKALWLHTVSPHSFVKPSSSNTSPTVVEKASHHPTLAEEKTLLATCAATSLELPFLLCSLFCRIVRQDAVPCEVSAGLDRLLRESF